MNNMNGALYIFQPLVGRHGEFDEQRKWHKWNIFFGYFTQTVIGGVQNQHAWIVH